jgi:hypothetical protein
MEEVLEWMNQIEHAAELYLLSHIERTMDELKSNEELLRWTSQDPIRVTRWLRIQMRLRQAELRQEQVWREIYRMEQHRMLLNRHRIRT